MTLSLELSKHGFAKRETGSEAVIDMLEEAARRAEAEGCASAVAFLRQKYEEFSKARPASVAVFNVLRQVLSRLIESRCRDAAGAIRSVKAGYEAALSAAAEVMAKRVSSGEVLMTNSNSLAVRKLFEALKRAGIDFKVYVLESRPGLEGLLMAEFLDRLGVETYLIVDSAARFFMKEVDKVVVGAEAVAANGAVVSKVGTSLMALAASEARVRVFAIAPTAKIGFETIYGELVKLPEGDWRLLMSEDVRRELPEKYAARAPIYDVTPPSMIDGIATELGLYPPQSIPMLVKSIYGSFPPKLEPIERLIAKASEVAAGG